MAKPDENANAVEVVKRNEQEGLLKLLRQLEMREKRQRETLEDTTFQLQVLKRQLGLK